MDKSARYVDVYTIIKGVIDGKLSHWVELWAMHLIIPFR